MTPPKRRTSGGPHAPTVPLSTHDRYTPPIPIARRGPPWWSRLAWPVAIVGFIVLAVGWVGAQTGAFAIPFDPHHVRSQFLGFGLLILSLRLGSGRRNQD